jgi:hypothetical protein
MDAQAQAMARQEAGRVSLHTVAQHGVEQGEDILTGYFKGFAIALVAVAGREALEEAYREIIGSVPPVFVGKPSPRVVGNE